MAQRPVFADDELKEVFLGWWDEDVGVLKWENHEEMLRFIMVSINLKFGISPGSTTAASGCKYAFTGSTAQLK